ncbi:MAG: SAP domain-containing protein [Anaerolineaceae bacterium]|nr:SAP domain-containing protein [Anaerolineaceae bacterium]
MSKKEDALKLFLGEFRGGSSTNWFDNKDYYKTKIYNYYLGNLKKTLDALSKDRMVRRMYPDEILDMDYRVPELKEECKIRGLKVSGKKADLIDRLLEADQDLRKACEKRDDLWICTAIGLVILEEFYRKMEQQEKDLQTQVFSLLEEKRYKDAAKAVEQIRNSLVFPDWMPNDFTSQISLDHEEKEVEIIWNDIPKALNKLKELSWIKPVIGFPGISSVEQIISEILKIFQQMSKVLASAKPCRP